MGDREEGYAEDDQRDAPVEVCDALPDQEARTDLNQFVTALAS
jgi:hypothetical protein